MIKCFEFHQFTNILKGLSSLFHLNVQAKVILRIKFAKN